MYEITMNKAKRWLLYMLVAFLAGALVTALVEVFLWVALFNFFPDEPDDSGFGGTGIVALLVVAACIGVPLFSTVAYFFRNVSTKKGNLNDD